MALQHLIATELEWIVGRVKFEEQMKKNSEARLMVADLSIKALKMFTQLVLTDWMVLKKGLSPEWQMSKLVE